MQKIKREVLDKMIAADLSSLQVDMMIYLSRYQSDSGVIKGVHYRSVCKDIGMSKQSFYNVLRSLEVKGLISLQREKLDSMDWNITILDNDCTAINNGSEKGQYVNTNQCIFYLESFRMLKAKEKLLAMYLLRRCAENRGSIRMTVSNFREHYTELLQVSSRTLRGYLASLKEYFSIGDKEGMRYVRSKRDMIKRSTMSERTRLHEYLVKVACRRCRISNPDYNAVKETAYLLHQYRRQIKQISDLRRKELDIKEVIQLSREYFPPKDKLQLNCKLVHKILRAILGLELMPPGRIVTE